jgi:hypothetical protein
MTLLVYLLAAAGGALALTTIVKTAESLIRLGEPAPHSARYAFVPHSGLVVLFAPLRGQSALTTFIALPGGALLSVAVAGLVALLLTSIARARKPGP